MPDLKIKLETLEGTIDKFFVFVNGKKVIQASGTKKPTHTAEKLPVGLNIIIVRVFGPGKARYNVNIDLPGSASDIDANRTFTFHDHAEYRFENFTF